MSDLAVISTEVILAGCLHSMYIGQSGIKNAISLVPKMNNEQRLEVAREATVHSNLSFLLRGCCAYYIVKSQVQPLPGGNGKKDEEGVGVIAQMAKLAKEIGVDGKTLGIEARIYEQFFKDKVDIEDSDLLPKTFYEAALSAKDSPQEAVELAQDKRSTNPNYTAKDFKNDVVALNGGATTEQLEDVVWLKYPISRKANEWLMNCCKLRNCTPGDYLDDILIMDKLSR